MKTITKLIFTISFTPILLGCVEKNGYYTPGEKSIISLICDIAWTTIIYEHENNETEQAIYNFNKNGTYTVTTIRTDNNGNENKTEYQSKWSFADPSLSTIYFGGNHYWDIDKLTKEKFSYYDRSGEFGDPFMHREYNELTPYKNTLN